MPSPRSVAAFNKAIGVPESVDGYEFALPDGVKPEDLEIDMITPLREAALEAGVPAKGFRRSPRRWSSTSSSSSAR
jgi:hypothetical protein